MPRLRFIARNRQSDHLWGRPEYRASPVTDFKQTIIAGYARDYDTSPFPHARSFRLTIRDRFERLLVRTVNFLWALVTQNHISCGVGARVYVYAILFCNMKILSFMIQEETAVYKLGLLHSEWQSTKLNTFLFILLLVCRYVDLYNYIILMIKPFYS